MTQKASSKNVALVFDPHPDDADWWTGGLSLLLVSHGWEVHYACVGVAEEDVKQQALASAGILGVSRHFLDLDIANSCGLLPLLRKALSTLLSELGARLIFIPSQTDYHQEHVTVSRELFRLLHWSAGLGLGHNEVYAYDSHENRDPIEIYIDVSNVWDKHIESLKCHTAFERPTIPENTLIRAKTGRAMLLGASVPADPVLCAEGYRLLQGDTKRISTLADILPEEFYYRNPQGLLAM